jgi:hypothetical protein
LIAGKDDIIAQVQQDGILAAAGSSGAGIAFATGKTDSEQQDCDAGKKK